MHSVTFSGVSFYRGETAIIDNISLTIPTGSIFGVLGKNGSGKSTVLKLITGLLFPTSGTISIKGVELTADTHSQVCNFVGSLIEDSSLYHNLTAYEMISWANTMSGNNLAKHQLDCILQKVGLTNIDDTVPIKMYSTGMKQKVGLALALLRQPSIIILDEPFNGLDVNSVNDMTELIKSLNKNEGITFIIVSHILGKLHNLIDSFCIIHKKSIVYSGSSSNLSHCHMQIVAIQDSDKSEKILFAYSYSYLTNNRYLILFNDNSERQSFINTLDVSTVLVENYEGITIEDYFIHKTFHE